MKRFSMLAALVALVLALPTAASAHRGHHRHESKAKSGVVKAFDATTGELTITTNKGRDVTALVDEDTRIECDSHDSGARMSHKGDDPQDDHGKDDDHGHHGGPHGDHDEDCGTDALVAGAEVRKARLDLDGDDVVWEQVKLAS